MRQRRMIRRLDVRIDEKLEARLNAHAREQNIPLSRIIRSFLLAGLAAQAPPGNAQEAQEVLERAIGGVKDVQRWLEGQEQPEIPNLVFQQEKTG